MKRSLLLVPALASCLTLGCQTAPEQVEEGARIRGSIEALERLQPADIAVTEVRNQTGDESLPIGVLRDGLSRALVQKLYSPLDHGYVDANWVEASFRGTPAPDAVLVVAVSQWDPSHLLSSGEVTAEAELILFEGGTSTGTVLWGITHLASVNLGDANGNPPTPSEDLLPRAVRQIAEEFLSTLPERDPIAAHPVAGTAP